MFALGVQTYLPAFYYAEVPNAQVVMGQQLPAAFTNTAYGGSPTQIRFLFTSGVVRTWLADLYVSYGSGGVQAPLWSGATAVVEYANPYPLFTPQPAFIHGSGSMTSTVPAVSWKYNDGTAEIDTTPTVEVFVLKTGNHLAVTIDLIQVLAPYPVSSRSYLAVTYHSVQVSAFTETLPADTSGSIQATLTAAPGEGAHTTLTGTTALPQSVSPQQVTIKVAVTTIQVES